MKRVVLALMVLGFAVGCEQFEGPVEIEYLGRIVAKGQYDGGVRVGKWVYFDYMREVKGEGTYKDGKMQNGLEILYFENGQKLREGTWTDGKRDGYWIEYYRSGAKKVEGTYLHGKKTGVWKEYDPSNFYITEKLYENDKQVGWRTYHQGRLGNPING